MLEVCCLDPHLPAGFVLTDRRHQLPSSRWVRALLIQEALDTSAQTFGVINIYIYSIYSKNSNTVKKKFILLFIKDSSKVTKTFSNVTKDFTKITVYTQILISTTVFNIDNNQKCFLSNKSAYYYYFWRSCNTEDWSNDDENTDLIIEINNILKCITLEKHYLKL